ncbi:sulfotransferase [Dissulfurirhabdus thermomarina]|uniref:Sulfotransferase n=1 Tax=Dissulfurirhabdus thermomarina TaxID=1765737 RepID=A0A6N9TKW3_DISTH|nr:sulfotransferase [Dissulfurirhabdus thermomarina]NDY41875.1 sulfotransferase [Dissulfurirhabdus thermomarina]NMX22576.1 sulfotransferase [Dissulfurirhabdus thermomarina]
MKTARPKKTRGIPPVIICGMHRSGTSLVARILEAAGLFIGKRKDRNSEALFFSRINDWILRRCGGSWDFPGPVRWLWRSEELRALVLDMLDGWLKHPLAIQYLGLGAWVRYGDVRALERPWGWKDPRSTLLLPLWTEVFPDAKVVYVERHGVDVARSLFVRAHREVQIQRRRYARAGWLYLLYQRYRSRGFSGSARCLDLEGGFELWEEYVLAAGRHAEALSGRFFSVPYEKFVQDPEAWLRDLCAFCGLEPGQKQIETCRRLVDGGRAHAYRHDEALVQFALEHDDRLGPYKSKP